MGKKMKSIEEQFEKNLKKRRLKQTTIDKCTVLVVFCPIVSRAGTDISTALSQLENDKQVILVVLHHTFDRNKTIPDSNGAVDRENTFAVDCLFCEDDGLLQCQKNEDAFNTFAKHLQKQRYAYLKSQPAKFTPVINKGSKPDQASRKKPSQGCCGGFWKRLSCCGNKSSSN